ncbi:hypothetical protein DFH08DRAFT_934709 [Mycena albidolilacea]|uniref:Uncharacterized protein n=1 Tax=Mycena albidolilacea TaxID=1033008 RepID=A0AAD7A8P0_9AGAR|nr:hypothetical protein DFH08DRAFT_934709 [Mycena albidolilacea]
MASASSQSFSSIAGGIMDVSAGSTLADDPAASNSVISEPASAAPVSEGEPANGGDEPAPPVKRGVGRPKGSKNKTTQPPLDLNLEKRPVGRPRGSGKKKEGPESPSVKRPVGRPRKDGLPPGSTSKAGYSTLVPPIADYRMQTGVPINQWVPFSGSISAPVAPSPAPVIDPALQRNEWAELAHSKPEQLLNVLLAALDAPNASSLTGPSVEEAFKSHLGSLAPPPSSSAPNSANGAPTQTIPSLYSILKTFWLPSSPSYFALTASATSARTPSPHRFLYWDPQPLVFNGIACPACAAPLANRGRIRSGPLTIHDLAGPFFVIGCAYACTANPAHVYASTDAAVRRALPAALEREFPVRLLAGDTGVGPDMWNWQARGVSRALWSLVLGALRTGLGRDVILQLVRGVQHGVPEAAGASEEDGVAAEGADADADAAPMEEEESAEEAAQGRERGPGDVLPPAAPALGPTDGSAGEPTAASANQAFNDAWTANSVIASLDIRNAPNPVLYGNSPVTYARLMFPQGAVPGVVPYDPAQHAQLPTLNKRPYPFEADIGVGGSSSGVSGTATEGVASPPAKKARSPRHCCKCGLQTCKGKGGRNFCTNACMDCNKFECPGRNSRRPDKRCESGWPEQLPQGPQPVQVQQDLHSHVQQQQQQPPQDDAI